MLEVKFILLCSNANDLRYHKEMYVTLNKMYNSFYFPFGLAHQILNNKFLTIKIVNIHYIYLGGAAQRS